MVLIGIAGGVGAGKSKVLSILNEQDRTFVLRADEVAHELMEPGKECYQKIRSAFLSERIYEDDGSIDRAALAALIFREKEKRDLLNSIVHPAVKGEILKRVEVARASLEVDFFFLEAALLIEEGYGKICDELWYVHADEQTRRNRLKTTRGYSDERIDGIMASQLPDEEAMKKCSRTIENGGSIKELKESLHTLLSQLKRNLKKESMTLNTEEEKKDYVFGLDIGTRNVVGTVGFLDDKEFNVVAQYSVEHDSRSMLDGQIHDINRVSKTIAEVKEELEAQAGFELKEVCIAAAGRVLRTVTTRVEHNYETETVVTGEDLNTLDLMGVDQAHRDLLAKNERYKFYCVGYTVMKYYLNGERFTNLEGHKANRIEEVIIVTFLPEDVVDGLYSAVERAGLTVANLTLEPIAAINVAIPESFRMLNIALVDVGAGTSDICITKDGSITAYGMIPYAGDELTEVLVQAFLVDFAMAERMKKESAEKEDITYTDIMGIEHTIKATEIWKLTDPVMDKITGEVAKKIRELNGDNSVAAAFIVGGGGKVHGFCKSLAKKLEIIEERVALRGEEVMKNVHFEQQEIKKDPLLVTPIGICLNYYEAKNNFIMVHLNGDMVKIYDNGHLKVVDAAMQAGYEMEDLFPQRGGQLNFMVNGKQRMAAGLRGESATVKMNGKEVGLNDRLIPNADIEIEKSTTGEHAALRVEQLEEYADAYVTFIVNEQKVKCPKFVEVNGRMEPGTHEIKEGDRIELVSYYTVGQLAAFMDVEVNLDHEILVNDHSADMDTLIYEDFAIDWTVTGYGLNEGSYRPQEIPAEPEEEPGAEEEETAEEAAEESVGAPESAEPSKEQADDGISAPTVEEILSVEEAAGETEAAEETGKDEAAETDDFLNEDGTLKAGGVTLEEARANPSVIGKIPEGMTMIKDGKEELVSKYVGVGYSGGVVKGDAKHPGRIAPPEKEKEEALMKDKTTSISVIANKTPITLTGKSSYVFADIFTQIDFDTEAGDGRAVGTTINGVPCGYAAPLADGDTVDVFWKDA